MTAVDSAIHEAAEGLSRAIASNLGVNLDAAQIVAIARELVTLGAGLVSSRQWQEAHAKGDEAASRINTLEEAEAAARGRK